MKGSLYLVRMDDRSVLALKININTKLQSEITKQSGSLQEETQQVIENLTDLMLVAERVTESLTPPPPVFEFHHPILLNTLVKDRPRHRKTICHPLSAHKKQPKPPVQVKHSKMMLRSPWLTTSTLTHQPRTGAAGAPLSPIALQQVPYLYSLGQMSLSVSIPTALNITY